jgi:hypothetical protein
MFAFLFLDLARTRAELLSGDDPESLIQQFIRTASEPLYPSKKDLAIASAALMREAAPHHKPRGAVRAQGAARARPDQGAGDQGAAKRRPRRRRGRGRRRPAGTGPGAPQGHA